METVDKPTPTQKQANKIFSYKPKGEQLTFLKSLIAEKGSMTTALQHCVECAMKGDFKDQELHLKEVLSLKSEITANTKMINEYIEREKQFRAEISNLKSHIEVLQADKKKKNELITEMANNRTGIGML